MELRQLRYFLAVCEELHFGRAAQKLHISQPPLSQQIMRLEDDLKVKLFFRTKRHVELTEAGRVFAGEARLILQQVEQAAGLALEAGRHKQSQLVLGCSSANINVAMNILREFSKRYPEIQVIVKSLVSPQQLSAIRNGQIDLGLVTLPVDPEGLTMEPILKERLVLALPQHHPLASRRNLSLRAIANETVIILPLHMSPGRYEQIASLCRNAGMSLRTVHEVDNVYTMLELISEGFGVSIMRSSIRGVRRKGIVFREFQHAPYVETAIAYRRDNRFEGISNFIDISKEVAAKI